MDSSMASRIISKAANSSLVLVRQPKSMAAQDSPDARKAALGGGSASSTSDSGASVPSATVTLDAGMMTGDDGTRASGHDDDPEPSADSSSTSSASGTSDQSAGSAPSSTDSATPASAEASST